MQGLLISVARHVNRARQRELGRNVRGCVFPALTALLVTLISGVMRRPPWP